jgi:fumarylacetoacetase
MDALAPFAVNGPAQDPAPLDYLQQAEPRSYAIELEVQLQTQKMRVAGTAPQTISQTTFDRMYWSVAQQLVHATVNGAIAAPGDLFASGTISGDAPGTQGSFIELSWNGERPLQLRDGETRTFLEDGDEVTLRAWCERPGTRRIGFGSATGRIVGA